MRRLPAALCVSLALAACGSAKPSARVSIGGSARSATIPAALLAGERPIGRGPRFQPPVRGSLIGPCSRTLGRRAEAHVEVFGADRVVLLPAGIGVRPPVQLLDGRLTRARCFGAVVTLDPTGTVYFRPGARLTLGDVFSSWGQTLGARQLASFRGHRTTVYLDGRAWHGNPTLLPLVSQAEIVLEIGPHVPPHRRFAFPPLPQAGMR